MHDTIIQMYKTANRKPNTQSPGLVGYRLEGPHEATQPAVRSSVGGAADRTEDGGATEAQQSTVVQPGHRFNQVCG